MAETTRTAPDSGRRPTRQRAAVAAVLADVDEFRSAQELHALLREAGEKVGLATVYRTLQSMAADGSIAVEPLMDVQQVANAVVYMANMPLDANIQFLTVMATKMPFIGRG